VDLDALKAHGYTVKWDKIKHQATVTSGANASKVDVPKPQVGELMLERGYQLVWENGSSTKLLSVGTRNYVPVSALKAQGWKLTKEGKNYKLAAA
jgi:hypothetical protein